MFVLCIKRLFIWLFARQISSLIIILAYLVYPYHSVLTKIHSFRIYMIFLKRCNKFSEVMIRIKKRLMWNRNQNLKPHIQSKIQIVLKQVNLDFSFRTLTLWVPEVHCNFLFSATSYVTSRCISKYRVVNSVRFWHEYWHFAAHLILALYLRESKSQLKNT